MDVVWLVGSKEGELNGLDLFSGIGGLTKALEGWVFPAAYCELDPYCRGVLLSRMAAGDLPPAPVWDDVTTLRGEDLPPVDIVYGGFPCQDISVAGRGRGLEGERSGLFFEIVRLAKEVKPKFVFLENVPAIRTRGLSRVVTELADIGYDCRWDTLSAADVGANHKRERWFLLALKSDGFVADSVGGGIGDRQQKQFSSLIPTDIKRAGVVRRPNDVAHPDEQGLEGRHGEELQERAGERPAGTGHTPVADSEGGVRQRRPQGEEGHAALSGEDVADSSVQSESRTTQRGIERQKENPFRAGWWSSEPDVGRVAHGVPKRVDRLRALGNAVVPAQAREAFARLMGLK